RARCGWAWDDWECHCDILTEQMSGCAAAVGSCKYGWGAFTVRVRTMCALRRHRSVLESSRIKRAADHARPLGGFEQLARDLQRGRAFFRHRHGYACLLKITSSTRAPGSLGSRPANESCERANAS